MHIQSLTKPLPARAEAKAIDRDIAFISMIVEFGLLIQEAINALFKIE